MENNIYSKKQTIKNYQNIVEIITNDEQLNKIKLEIILPNNIKEGLLKDDNFEIILPDNIKEMIDNINKIIEHRIETLKIIMEKIRITYIVDSDDMSDDEFDNQEDQYFTVNESMIKDLIMKEFGYDSIDILAMEKIN
jgi:hypothetical protein